MENINQKIGLIFAVANNYKQAEQAALEAAHAIYKAKTNCSYFLTAAQKDALWEAEKVLEDLIKATGEQEAKQYAAKELKKLSNEAE